MYPADDVALASGVEACKNEICSHFIQPVDLTGGHLRHILVPSDYNVLTAVSSPFSVLTFIFWLIHTVHVHYINLFKSLTILLFCQDDPSKAEMSEKMEATLQFPTDADLKDLKKVEGDFSGEFHFSDFLIEIWPF